MEVLVPVWPRVVILSGIDDGDDSESAKANATLSQGSTFEASFSPALSGQNFAVGEAILPTSLKYGLLPAPYILY